MKPSTTDLLDAFKNMTLTEVTEFRRQFEDTFGVTADVAPQIVHDEPPAVVEEVQTEFKVTLEAAGEKKINVIKTVREITKLGLKEAKDFVDAAPNVLFEAVTKDAADDAAERLRAVGAEVTVS
jgi:large subunit ribosomal protein L7/L12